MTMTMTMTITMTMTMTMAMAMTMTMNMTTTLVWQLDTMTQNDLISRYYALDDQVARELLGKKLSGRLRKDLDEIREAIKKTIDCSLFSSLTVITIFKLQMK